MPPPKHIYFSLHPQQKIILKKIPPQKLSVTKTQKIFAAKQAYLLSSTTNSFKTRDIGLLYKYFLILEVHQRKTHFFFTLIVVDLPLLSSLSSAIKFPGSANTVAL